MKNEENSLFVRLRNSSIIIWLLGLILLLLYARNITDIVTVWEIGDEAGYLSNAAFLAGENWNSTRAVLPYYGYGYSLLLIPFFWICSNGVEIIRCAIGVNIVCIIASYFIQVWLMSRIIKNSTKNVIAVIAFLVNLYPYIVSSSMKVICEVFLTFQYWLIGFLLYRALQSNARKNFMILGMASAFIFFIHTRGIIVIAAIFLVVLLGVIKHKIDWEKALYFCVLFFVLFIFGYILKKYIIASAYENVVLGRDYEALKSVNMISSQYIKDRLEWLLNLKNLKLYLQVAAGKVFYLLSGTGLMIMLGMIEIVKRIIAARERTTEEWACNVYFFLAFLCMFGVTCVNGTGMRNSYGSFFYGRYYEYTIGAIIFLGIYACIQGDVAEKMILLVVIIGILLGISTLGMEQYWDSTRAYVDTARISAFSLYTAKNPEYHELIKEWMLLLSVVGFGLIFAKRNQYRMFITTFIILILFALNDKECIAKIKEVNQVHEMEVIMAQYISNEGDDKNLFFVEGIYKGSTCYFSVMQALVKDKPLILIGEEEAMNIEEDAYLMCYHGADNFEEMNQKYEYIMGNHVFELFKTAKGDR